MKKTTPYLLLVEGTARKGIGVDSWQLMFLMETWDHVECNICQVCRFSQLKSIWINKYIPCFRTSVCSVTDRRWRQNVVRTRKWHTRCSWVCHWCSYHILTSAVLCCWTDTWQHGVYLFYILLWRSKVILMVTSSLRLFSNRS